jgi:hypothetical protein
MNPFSQFYRFTNFTNSNSVMKAHRCVTSRAADQMTVF